MNYPYFSHLTKKSQQDKNNYNPQKKHLPRQEKAEEAQKLYQENTEGNYFIASNLTDSKTTLTSNGVTVDRKSVV